MKVQEIIGFVKQKNDIINLNSRLDNNMASLNNELKKIGSHIKRR